MKNIAYIVIIAAIALIPIIKALNNKNGQKSDDNIVRYRKKYLLTKNEYSFFQKIKPVIKKHNLNILCKVRLADLIEPIPTVNKSEWYAGFNRIKSKHIDFVLVTENMQVVMLIELEDNSHLKEDRIKRDNFVISALKQVDYKLICVYNNDESVRIVDSALSTINNKQ
ncbi:MAG: DUF2726 domain-containing protein [Ruminococcus sp.]